MVVGRETEKEPEGEPGEPGDSAPLVEEEEEEEVVEEDGVRVTLAVSPRVPALTPADGGVVVAAVGVWHLAVVELTMAGGEVPGA